MDDKEIKILTCNNIKPPVEGRCGFFVKRKQRYCKMLPAKGNRYCAEHLSQDKQQDENRKRKRIDCPLDPKHTVFEDKLSKHLKKCNATLKTQLHYFSNNINLGIPDYIISEEEKVTLYHTPVEVLQQLITKVKECYRNITMETVKENHKQHPVLDEEMSQPGYGASVKKHLIQQASLVSLLDDMNVLQNSMAVIEFGAGRGALSHWIQKAMADQLDSKFFLVDRQHNRNKLDCYHKGDDQGPNFERLNIDIQHLNLANVLPLTNSELEIVGVGKHLCGGATDLSLRCLFENQEKETKEEQPSKRIKKGSIASRIHSILFALCCYHRCTWSTYVGTKYLSDKGFSSLDFHRITKMAGWATCGFERRTTETQKDDDRVAEEKISKEHEDRAVEEENSKEHDDRAVEKKNLKVHAGLGLTSHEQEEIGRMCKRIIDHGRLEYIRSYGYRCELIKYVDKEITPENIALCVRRRKTNDS
ncbi:tRNA:m(4)X modification enzyme TRM13 homolog [Hydractinia symbiolongicarpus]|uniref:tRNA:m(4)X modification enzyme TRM13 homolog n=1 Tax=Hydractinia symbiolongicarpus TaxID=13093 RepID=UPI00255005C3|nr:tRNA:m(4)X modification enzyme TRM13 homolog [Hydractinia symbiolongicarpus]